MLRDIEVQDLAALVLNDEETVQQFEVTVGTVKKSRATVTSR